MIKNILPKKPCCSAVKISTKCAIFPVEEFVEPQKFWASIHDIADVALNKRHPRFKCVASTQYLGHVDLGFSWIVINEKETTKVKMHKVNLVNDIFILMAIICRLYFV